MSVAKRDTLEKVHEGNFPLMYKDLATSGNQAILPTNNFNEKYNTV